ncbi:MAG: SIR2 family protein, partial [Candidatus Poribacteria bacterium]|nr:SIR2 family protein [Candidatus Poribacteria bacterium]
GYYIQHCFPISDDRRAYFQEKIRRARPQLGYQLLCHLAQADLIRSVWTTNFDSLVARSAARFNLTPLEVGIDTQNRLHQQAGRGELLCVSLHGDYRYDDLKNTPDELQNQEESLRNALIEEMKVKPLVICGYSGRDHSIMEAMLAACSERGTGALYWCGYSDSEIPSRISALIQHARDNGRQAYYVPALGFDDLMTRLAFHCLEGDLRESARKDIVDLAPTSLLERQPFQIPELTNNTVIKSNAFEVDCPLEVLTFELRNWPKERVWFWLREQIGTRPIVAVPFKGKVLALGLIDDIKDTFVDRIKGLVERTPVNPREFSYQNGTVVGLMRQALVRSLAQTEGVATDGKSEIWLSLPSESHRKGNLQCQAHESVVVFLRRIGNKQYVVLKPSIKVLEEQGLEVPYDVAKSIKLRILGYQHNKPFNQAVNRWRKLFFPNKNSPTVDYEFPSGSGSSFRFRIRRSPVFAKIGLRDSGKSQTIPQNLRPLLKDKGVELSEPSLRFCNPSGTGTTVDTHPIRGIVSNRPFDYPLTLKGLAASLRIGVICPRPESPLLAEYLYQASQEHRPEQSERDYLIDYPGFHQAYGLPIGIPSSGTPGWSHPAEPLGDDQRATAVSVAHQITSAVDALLSSFSPHVVLIFYPNRWEHIRGYRDDNERFDVHDFVKAYAVQRGIATQFLTQATLSDNQRCRVWWWLSLALYVKGMRTPWVLDGLDDDTAYVGLGYSLEHSAEKATQVVLGCSHIYSSRGEGLQYRLSKVENPLIMGRNPFMSRDDARRTGETIRQLFFEARSSLPRRVVLHKRTQFLKGEREGLIDGLGEVEAIDMLEVQVDNALRYVASKALPNGRMDDDNYPVRRGTVMKQDDFSALLWVHGATSALIPTHRYYQGKRRIPAPLTLRRHSGNTPLDQIGAEILGLSKMDWNSFDLYSKMPATLQSSGEIARIGSLLQRFGASSYDYRLFI